MAEVDAEALGRRPVLKLAPPVRAALRLGAYQLAFSEVAMHAAVNESVELVRGAGLERAVSFTNAVLRRLALGLRELLEGLPETTPVEAALRHSYPDWVAETWWRDFGPDEALALMRAQNEPPETVVRRNALKPGDAVGEPDPEIPGALRVERVDEQALADGLIWPQSRGSQLAGLCVGVQAGERVLDLCAAPGGKATQLAERAAEVVAVEKHPGRARELEANCRRLGAPNVRVVNVDALDLPDDLRGFDRALVDAARELAEKHAAFAEARLEMRHRKARELPDRADTHRLERRRGHPTDAPEARNGQRRQEALLGTRLDHHQSVRLAQVRGDLRDELARGDADGGREPHGVPDARLDGAANGGPVTEERAASAHVEKRLVDGDGLEQRAPLGQDRHDLS